MGAPVGRGRLAPHPCPEASVWTESRTSKLRSQFAPRGPGTPAPILRCGLAVRPAGRVTRPDLPGGGGEGHARGPHRTLQATSALSRRGVIAWDLLQQFTSP